MIWQFVRVGYHMEWLAYRLLFQQRRDGGLYDLDIKLDEDDARKLYLALHDIFGSRA